MDSCPQCGAAIDSEVRFMPGVSQFECGRKILHCGWGKDAYVERCRIRELEAENRDLIALIDDLTDGWPCQYDDHGRCQQHDSDRPCPEERARAVLDAQLKRVEASQ